SARHGLKITSASKIAIESLSFIEKTGLQLGVIIRVVIAAIRLSCYQYLSGNEPDAVVATQSLPLSANCLNPGRIAMPAMDLYPWGCQHDRSDQP
ncbi:MAG: hypothetical protein EA370_01950, partial [Wenzhouxiangella sp.]